jgi:hypothetical protein
MSAHMTETTLVKWAQDSVAALLTLPVPSGQSPEASLVRDLMIAVLGSRDLPCPRADQDQVLR